jgi:ATP-dependent exoDNAse (exonuclease V) alpha subunit
MISSNKSYFVEGRGGTGKSTLINLMKEKLKNNNINFQTLAPTNKAANIIDGKTIHRFIKTASKLKEKELEYIFVDEISMVKEIFYSYFLFLKRLKKNVKFIIAGDFNQLLPVKDRARYDYENSVAFHELIDSNKVTLTKCRRANDEFFNLTAPENVMKLTGKEFGKKLTDRNICYTNEKRKEINKQLMEKHGKLKKTRGYEIKEIKGLAYDKNSQDMILYKGLPVIARMNNRKLNLINNDEFYVERIGGKDVKLVNQFNKQFSIIVELKMFNRLFYPAYAITVHKAQGSTYTTPFTIHQFDFVDRRLRYVSLSRASQLELVNCF